MTTRREQTSHESSELILRAAAELFAAKGYRQTTFADVAERSGISRGSIPWHFGSKEGLLLAVLERSVDLIRAELIEEPGELAAPEEAEAGFDRLMGGADALFAQPTTKLFVTLLVEALEPGSPIHGRYVEIHNTLRDHCRRWLERLPLPPGLSAETLAVTIIGAGIGIHQQWLLAPDRVDPEQALAALRTLVTAAVLPTGE
ncbi:MULTISPECIES: TetR/AcrR family transcriptional regulator [Streptomyces]|uniref:TetR/AcrR family transcriptional regulator n=1 Tax=Streptomyces TaxID=1883 RepID=UPI0011DFA5A3|nr:MULTISPECIES: TetR/AcrR family transcriptional regulator [Streptomyces]MCW7984317.1 TetR family transcriptional regulator [Streptomyces platensis subsp. clarensis]MCX5443974.1 TetR/AcrR family transcriptional regulator [Streptomyces libani]WDT53095.1 TetR/AcrR family transcriptional regulator [Streptomyces sp. G7(2002)]